MAATDLASLAHVYRSLYATASNIGHGRIELCEEAGDALLDAWESGDGAAFADVADDMGDHLGGTYEGSTRYETRDMIVTEWSFHVGDKTVVVVAKQPRRAPDQESPSPRPRLSFAQEYHRLRRVGYTAEAAFTAAKANR